MTDLATLARPYAEAVFAIAKQSDSVVQWSDMLGFLSAVVADADVIKITNNPKVSKASLQQLLLNISQDQLNQQGSNFLKLLIENGRIMLLPEIAGLYQQSRAEDEGYIDVDVKTAYAFTESEENKIVATLEKKLKKSVHINVQTDTSLIAGFWAKAGDTVIDATLKGQIQQLVKIL